MKTRHTLYATLVFYVFGIMTASNSLSSLLLILLRESPLSSYLARPLLSTAWTLVLAVFIGTFLTAWLGKVYLRPMTRLIEATGKIAQGDFSVRLQDDGGGSEMSVLQRSFNSMAKQLGSIELFRSDFINNFSHEFRTPIVSIRGFARQLLRDDLTDQQRREYASIIVSESERLSHLATNILLLSSLENRQIITDVTTFRLDEQLRACILLLEKSWSGKQQEMNVELEDMTWSGNADLLSQVWVNLIGNAVKFTPPGGRISVRLTHEDGCAVVCIEDSGIGMSEEAQSHLFEKFFQADSSHHFEGNGLGLAMVKRIVDLNGGSITVRSAEGRGTAFTVKLFPRS